MQGALRGFVWFTRLNPNLLDCVSEDGDCDGSAVCLPLLGDRTLLGPQENATAFEGCELGRRSARVGTCESVNTEDVRKTAVASKLGCWNGARKEIPLRFRHTVRINSHGHCLFVNQVDLTAFGDANQVQTQRRKYRMNSCRWLILGLCTRAVNCPRSG